MCRSGAESKRRQLAETEITHQGGGEGMTSGGLPGKGRDADGDEGTFMAQACTGRHDHLGGGKPHSSKVLTMRHAGPVAVFKW